MMKGSKTFTHSRPNCFTASTMDLSFSMVAYIECSLKSISCATLRTSPADARGTATTPSASAAMMSPALTATPSRSEEHTSELQSHSDLVCRLLLEKKKELVRSQKA